MKKYFKTVITVTVLSEDFPVSNTDLNDIAYMITDGDCSGEVSVTSVVELTETECATALIEQGSDPEFFGIGADDSE